MVFILSFSSLIPVSTDVHVRKMAGFCDEKNTNDNSISNKTLLEETFYILSKKKTVFKVKLTKSGLSLFKENNEGIIKEQLISIKDIIGCRCLRSKKQKNSCTCRSLKRTNNLKVVDEKSEEHDDEDISAYLYIYAYILPNNNSNRRERTIITLRFRTFDKYEDNYKEAQRWRIVLKKLLGGENYKNAEICRLAACKEERRFLFFLNPKSGTGRGKILFQKKILPILQEAEIPYDLQVTKYANYATDFIKTCNIYQWTNVVVVGGDGILFEVLNGMFQRPDWSEVAKRITLGIIPGGSGNGLARTIAQQYCEPYFPNPTLSATLGVVKRNIERMDVVRVETRNRIMFSFLAVGWGLISDIDIESETFRILGSQRFTLWSLARLIGLRSYSGNVYYLPLKDDEKRTKKVDDDESQKVDRKERSDVGDFPEEVLLESDDAKRTRHDSWYSAASRRSAYFSMVGSVYQSTTDGDTLEGLENARGTARTYGPPSFIPALTATVPDDWVHVSGPFVMVHASYQSYLGEDCFFAPESKLNDGIIWLLIVHAKATRSQILQFLLGLSTGAHAASAARDENGTIEFVRCRAFRIEPDENEQQGHLTVDGEHVEYGPIQAEIFEGLVEISIP